MTLTLENIDRNLRQAKEDVTFWEQARTLLLDPRVRTISASPNGVAYVNHGGVRPSVPRAPHGDLKRRVYEALPEWEQPGMTTAEIATKMERGGYVFSAKVPSIAVNEAIASLGEQAHMAGKRGVAKLWTKNDAEYRLSYREARKKKEATEAAS